MQTVPLIKLCLLEQSILKHTFLSEKVPLQSPKRSELGVGWLADFFKCVCAGNGEGEVAVGVCGQVIDVWVGCEECRGKSGD